MEIEIKIENKIIDLSLVNKKQIIDQINFPDERRLSQELLPAIDRLLLRNGLTSADVEKINFKSDIPDTFTTFRIAKAVAETFNWARKC